MTPPLPENGGSTPETNPSPPTVAPETLAQGRSRFATRLAQLAVSLVVLSVGVSTLIAYRLRKESLETSLGDELLAIVNSVAPLIDADLHQLVRRGPDGALQSEEEFEALRQQLTRVKHRNRLTSHGSPIYTLRPAADFDQTRELEFVVMTDRDQQGRYFVGNRYPAQPHLLEALAGRAARTPLYADSEGMWISAAAPIVTESGEVIGVVQADRTANYFHNELRRQSAALALGALATVCLASLLAVIFARTLVRPIAQLAEAIRRIARGEFGHRVRVRRQDEIGDLAACFNTMADTLQQRDQTLENATKGLLEAKETLELRVHERTRELFDQVGAKERALVELAEAQQLLAATSRQAGMAEIATGVLHNVGNVLNSVNVSATLVQDRLKQSKLGSLIKTISLLSEHSGDLAAFLTADPQGRRVPGFLAKLSGHLSAERAQVLEEMAVVACNVDHIKQIVAMQQTYATASGVIESLPPAQLVEDALNIHRVELARHQVEVVRDFEPVPSVAVDKHKVLQILINLISNARYAVSHDGKPERRITVRLRRTPRGCVAIGVADNGLGIAPENLTKIFRHGFTTKKDGHGFGLHSGALAAREMGGSLTVGSEGIGKGAEFTLELPIDQRLERAA